MELKQESRYTISINAPHHTDPVLIHTTDLESFEAILFLIQTLHIKTRRNKIQIIKQTRKFMDLTLFQAKTLVEDIQQHGLPGWLHTSDFHDQYHPDIDQILDESLPKLPL